MANEAVRTGGVSRCNELLPIGVPAQCLADAAKCREDGEDRVSSAKADEVVMSARQDNEGVSRRSNERKKRKQASTCARIVQCVQKSVSERSRSCFFFCSNPSRRPRLHARGMHVVTGGFELNFEWIWHAPCSHAPDPLLPRAAGRRPCSSGVRAFASDRRGTLLACLQVTSSCNNVRAIEARFYRERGLVDCKKMQFCSRVYIIECRYMIWIYVQT